MTRPKRNTADSTAPAHRPRPARKCRILLVMGLPGHQRLLGIARYARRANWVLDSRLVTFQALGQHTEYVASAEYDGVLALLSIAAPWQVPLVRSLRLPVVDLWRNYPDEPYPRVLLDHVAAGRLGAEHLLDRLIDGSPAPTEPLLIPPVGVITRASTDILAVRDPNVSAAVHYIWANFRLPITVDDVARQCAVSRRLLQDRFRDQVGYTIAEEITRLRVNCAKRLLAGTDQKLQSIAADAGFGTAEQLSKVFRRVVGTSPQAYRLRYRTADPNINESPGNPS